MKLHEYQSKIRLAQYGIPIPSGETVSTPQAAYEVADKLGGSVVIKPQLLVSEYAKTNQTIQSAHSPQETFDKAKVFLENHIMGQTIHKILIEALCDFTTQIYLGIVISGKTGMPMMVAALFQNPETEATTFNDLSHPFFIEQIHPYLGLHDYKGRNLASSINLPYEYWSTFSSIASNLAKCFFASDSIQLEINSLALTTEKQLIALSTTMFIDDHALYRQPEVLDLIESTDDSTHTQSHSIGLHYTQLNGHVGCLANGSGLAMTTLDALYKYGGDEVRAANIVDIGTETRESNLQSALEMLLSPIEINVLFLNLFSVITPCDQIARILLRVLQKTLTKLPIVVRLAGKNADAGYEIVRSANPANLIIVSDISDAAFRAVKAGRGDESWRS